jgi:hypothetical protein
VTRHVSKSLTLSRRLTRLSLRNSKPPGQIGLAVFHSALKTVTVGFPAPLLYSESLKLSVTVDEPNVAQIVGNVIHGA